MYKKRIGSVMVEKNGSPYGIFTERDLLNKVLRLNVNLEENVGIIAVTPSRWQDSE
jgi:signal-transduction protein with cAMP-binding, CBS, and nucleotidyltransferase domain